MQRWPSQIFNLSTSDFPLITKFESDEAIQAEVKNKNGRILLIFTARTVRTTPFSW